MYQHRVYVSLSLLKCDARHDSNAVRESLFLRYSQEWVQLQVERNNLMYHDDIAVGDNKSCPL